MTVVSDSPPSKEVLASMTEKEVLFLKERCGCAKNETLTWYHHCIDAKRTTNLGYSWQSEFRTYHIWKQPILANYRYMIWLESDAYATKICDKDPIKLMVENDLVVMYDHFPKGRSALEVIPKIRRAYNQSLCSYDLLNKGYLAVDTCSDRNHTEFPKATFPLIHGFHHITDLDFYRSERTMRFLKILIEDYKFIRKFDDQIGVTLPAAIDAPNRSWDYRMNGLKFSISHHGDLDGDIHTPAAIRGYHKFHWKINRKKWVAGAKMCDPWISQRG